MFIYTERKAEIQKELEENREYRKQRRAELRKEIAELRATMSPVEFLLGRALAVAFFEVPIILIYLLVS